jgi:hypothetical protein
VRSARRLVPAVVALAVLGVAGCSGSSTGTSTSGSTSTSASDSSSAPAVSPAPSATGSVGVPSVDSSRLAAIATCLKNANLPTPTSTDAVRAAAELVRLVRDPATAAALRACGIPLPGAGSPTTS